MNYYLWFHIVFSTSLFDHQYPMRSGSGSYQHAARRRSDVILSQTDNSPLPCCIAYEYTSAWMDKTQREISTLTKTRACILRFCVFPKCQLPSVHSVKLRSGGKTQPVYIRMHILPDVSPLILILFINTVHPRRRNVLKSAGFVLDTSCSHKQDGQLKSGIIKRSHHFHLSTILWLCGMRLWYSTFTILIWIHSPFIDSIIKEHNSV